MEDRATVEARVRAAIENLPYTWASGRWDDELDDCRIETLREFYSNTYQGHHADELFDAVVAAVMAAAFPEMAAQPDTAFAPPAETASESPVIPSLPEDDRFGSFGRAAFQRPNRADFDLAQNETRFAAAYPWAQVGLSVVSGAACSLPAGKEAGSIANVYGDIYGSLGERYEAGILTIKADQADCAVRYGWERWGTKEVTSGEDLILVRRLLDRRVKYT